MASEEIGVGSGRYPRDAAAKERNLSHMFWLLFERRACLRGSLLSMRCGCSIPRHSYAWPHDCRGRGLAEHVVSWTMEFLLRSLTIDNGERPHAAVVD